jgi:hypothetical protein
MISLDLILIGAAIVLGLAAVAAAGLAWRGESSLLAMGDTPTVSVAEAVARHRRALQGGPPLGEPVEVVGTIECDAPLQAPYSEQLCVAYDYVVSEEHERRVGRRGLYRGREVESHSLDVDERRAPRFYVHDATGRIAVDPEGAQIDMLETVARYSKFTGDGGSEREIWREEHALLLGYRVYVLGYLADDGGQPVLRRHPAGRRFLISHRDERAFAAAVRRRAYALYLAGGLGLGAAVGLAIAAYVF